MKVENLNTNKKSNWGGAREGSGRKPRLQYEIRELFNNAIDDEWEEILKAVISQAKKGDKETLKWVIEQRIGKAPQSMVIDARGAFLGVTESIQQGGGTIPDDEISEIAAGISAELRRRKTEMVD